MPDDKDLYGPGSPYLHPRQFLTKFPSVTVTEEVCTKFRNGRAVNLPDYSDSKFVRVFASQTLLIGVARRIAGTLFHPEVVLYGSNEKLPDL
jgi:tRNA pseudouridine55 synthase